MSHSQNASKTVALFPGQGSQHVGMAKELCDNFAVARQVFEEASEAIKVDLKKLCFDGPEAQLTLTEFTQPSLLTASVAAFRVARAEFGFAPDAVAGHSLGEYSALVAAGSLPLARAAYWVRERGRAMQTAVPAGQGTMAAIMGMDDEVVVELCKQATQSARDKRAKSGTPETADGEPLSVDALVEAANFNAPGQVVIAGSTDGVAEALALIAAAKGTGGPFSGGKAIPLQVSAPFHCKLMAPARERMAELFALATGSEKARAPEFAYVPNRTARLTREAGVVFDLLIEQVDHPVLWRQTMTGLFNEGFLTTVEVGPGRVLAGLAKRIAQKVGPEPLSPRIFGISDCETLKQTAEALQ
jgi:[acyl-carrier-protein] S-malonyltransferase